MDSGKFAPRSANEPRSGSHSAKGRHAASTSRPIRSEDALIRRLRDLPAGPSPDLRFTSELRSQLVSIAPRIIAESASEHAGLGGQANPSRAGFLGKLRRPLIAFVGAAAVLTMLLSLAVWMSHGALPGQSLYGIKRASENVHLSLADSDAERAKAYLQQATSRATETTKLVKATGQPQQPSGHLANLLAATLGSADSDTRSGIELLGKLAVAQSSTAPITGINDWVSQQRGRLTELENRLPAGSARSRTATSLALLQRVATRLAAWQTALDCRCQSVSHSDELGPSPAATGPASGGLPSFPTSSTSPLPTLSLPALGGSPSPTGS